jgi:hypothetical protein
VSVNWQLPAPPERVAVQDSPEFANTVTLPVGVPVNCGATLTFTVTGEFSFDGFGVCPVIVVVVVAALTITEPEA